MHTFELSDDHIPLNKLLKVLGWVDSGGQAGLLIDAGEVTVDGQVERRKRCKVTPGQVVRIEGQQVQVMARAGAKPK